MIWTYLGDIGKKALTPAVRVTDGLQIAVASALPAVAKFLGIKLPETIGTDALSYIGAVAVAFLTIRFFWAPYALWKEQVIDNKSLKLELSKPETLVMVHMAKERAKKRVKIASLVSQMLIKSHGSVDSAQEQMNSLSMKIFGLAGQSGFPLEFSQFVARSADYLVERNSASNSNDNDSNDNDTVEVINSLIEFTNGEITLDELRGRLPSKIANGK
ncbi:MAG: hypothetical protein Pars92KO_10150 [Parasphingorhabdus sp.]